MFLFYSYWFLFPCGCPWMNFKLRGFQWYVTILRTHVDNHCRNALIRARPKKQFRFDRHSLRFEVRVAVEPNPFGMWFAPKTVTRICGYCKIASWLISASSRGGKCWKKMHGSLSVERVSTGSIFNCCCFSSHAACLSFWQLCLWDHSELERMGGWCTLLTESCS